MGPGPVINDRKKWDLGPILNEILVKHWRTHEIFEMVLCSLRLARVPLSTVMEHALHEPKSVIVP